MAIHVSEAIRIGQVARKGFALSLLCWSAGIQRAWALRLRPQGLKPFLFARDGPA